MEAVDSQIEIIIVSPSKVVFTYFILPCGKLWLGKKDIEKPKSPSYFFIIHTLHFSLHKTHN